MKITRRRLLVGSVVAVAVIGGAWFGLAEHGPPYGVTRSAYRAIRLGMTREEVERIVGEPSLSGYSLDGAVSLWIGADRSVLGVYFDEDGLVRDKEFRPSILDRLLGQLQDFWGKLGF